MDADRKAGSAGIFFGKNISCTPMRFSIGISNLRAVV
jgi:hypothetical protein